METVVVGACCLQVSYPAALLDLKFDAAIDKIVGKPRARARSDNVTREIEFAFHTASGALAAKDRVRRMHPEITASVTAKIE